MEVKNDLKKVKEILLGNGNIGIIGRLQRLEFTNMSFLGIFNYLINIFQAILISYITFKIMKGGI